MDRPSFLLDQANLLLAASGLELSPSQHQKGGVAVKVSNFTLEKKSGQNQDENHKHHHHNLHHHSHSHHHHPPPSFVAVKNQANSASSATSSTFVNQTTMGPLAIAMLHDVAATKELIELSDALRIRELEKLRQVEKLLQDEKSLRRDYILQLQEQAEDLTNKRKKLLAPYLNNNNNSNNTANFSQFLAPNSLRIGERDDDGVLSSYSGNNNPNETVPSSAQRRMRSQTILSAVSPSVYVVGTKEQLTNGSIAFQNNNHQIGGTSSSPQQQSPPPQFTQNQQNNNNNNFGSGMSVHSLGNKDGGAGSLYKQPIRQNGSNNSVNQTNTNESPAVTKQRIANMFPGVSFGALTTASAASRYAKHWTNEGHGF